MLLWMRKQRTLFSVNLAEVRTLPKKIFAPPLRIRASVLVLLAVFLLQAFGRLAFIAFAPAGSSPLILNDVNGFLYAVSVGAVLVFLRKKGFALFSKGSFAPVNVLYFIPLIALACGLCILLSESDNFIRALFQGPDVFYEDPLLHKPTLAGTFVTCISFGVVTPVMMELLFRGVMLQNFLQRHTRTESVLSCAFLFSAFYANPFQCTTPFFVGLFLCVIYLQTKSLIPCIVFHSIFNLLPIILLQVMDVRIDGFTITGKAIHQPLSLTAAGGVLVLFSLCGLYLYHRFYKERKDAE